MNTTSAIVRHGNHLPAAGVERTGAFQRQLHNLADWDPSLERTPQTLTSISDFKRPFAAGSIGKALRPLLYGAVGGKLLLTAGQ